MVLLRIGAWQDGCVRFRTKTPAIQLPCEVSRVPHQRKSSFDGGLFKSLCDRRDSLFLFKITLLGWSKRKHTQKKQTSSKASYTKCLINTFLNDKTSLDFNSQHIYFSPGFFFVILSCVMTVFRWIRSTASKFPLLHDRIISKPSQTRLNRGPEHTYDVRHSVILSQGFNMFALWSVRGMSPRCISALCSPRGSLVETARSLFFFLLPLK